tara:strand:- start:459 stop:695 length:237 start_codon:yes stop_codon:yes gene_type:complete
MRKPQSEGIDLALDVDDGHGTRLSCAVCLTEIPPDAVNVIDAQDYVHHFCGLGCFEKWQKQAESSQRDLPGKPVNQIK